MGRGGTTPLRARHVGIIRYLSVDCQWDVGANHADEFIRRYSPL